MNIKVFLKDIQANVLIGAYESEQTQKQPLSIDVEFSLNASLCALSDRLEDTLDYDAMTRQIKKIAENLSCKLLETFIVQLHHKIQSLFETSKLKLKVYKPLATGGLAKVHMEYEGPACQ